jgi:glycosyltransferase involved in cell wall biosynthesis
VARRLGYLFERFPAFTQTFCAREVAELYRQGLCPPVFSIRRPDKERPVNIPLDSVKIRYLPDTNSVGFKLRTKLIAPKLRRIWSSSGDTRDKNRFYEALYLAHLLRREDIGHLHVHFAGLAARTAWWIKKLFGITYSVTGHAKDIFCPEPGTRVTLQDLVDDAAFIVTVSDYSADYLRKNVPAAAQKIFRVYNGLDLALFRPARPQDEPVKLLSVGRLIKKKGFADLIRACDRLRQSGKQFQCDIVGTGPDGPELENQIKEAGLNGTVRLLGPRSQADLVELLAQTQIFVFPAIRDRSGDSDNLPTVIIEAMASGLPVVATRIAGIPEIVAEKQNGFLVDEQSPDQLALAIGQLLDDRPLRLQFGTESQLMAGRTFRLDQTVAQLRDLFARHAGLKDFAAGSS